MRNFMIAIQAVAISIFAVLGAHGASETPRDCNHLSAQVETGCVQPADQTR